MELRCDNIQYSIEGSRILNGISLGVSNNEFHTILGPNGCGKTTFLKTVYRITNRILERYIWMENLWII